MVQFKEEVLQKGVVVHCNTKEKCNALQEWAQTKGFPKRFAGRADDMCFYLEEGEWDHLEDVPVGRYKILTYEEALLGTMPKLEAGMIVESSSGAFILYVTPTQMYMVMNGVNCGNLCTVSDENIVAIYKPTPRHLSYQYIGDTPIWEREPELTETQKKIAELKVTLAELEAVEAGRE